MRKLQTNLLVRESLKENDVYLYMLADAMGISEPTMCRMMRKELPEKAQMLMVAAIEGIAAKFKEEE